MNKTNELIDIMCEWKFFKNGFYELNDEDTKKFEKELEAFIEKLKNEEI